MFHSGNTRKQLLKMNIDLISNLFPNFRSCTPDNSYIARSYFQLLRKNSLICENKAIYILYIQTFNFSNFDFFGRKFEAFLG